MIIVNLSPAEARAYEQTRDTEEHQIEDVLLLDAMVQFPSLDVARVRRGVEPMIDAAKSARRKIAEATAFEIRVVEVGA